MLLFLPGNRLLSTSLTEAQKFRSSSYSTFDLRTPGFTTAGTNRLKGIGSPHEYFFKIYKIISVLSGQGKSQSKYTCPRWFTELFSESNPGYWASFTQTGGFLDAATRSLKRVKGRMFKINKFFPSAHIQKVLNWFLRPLKKLFILWHCPFNKGLLYSTVKAHNVDRVFMKIFFIYIFLLGEPPFRKSTRRVK